MNDIIFGTVTRRIELAAILLATALITYANYLVFLVVPNEKFMGPVQRIFYFHVGSAIASYFAFAIVFIASLVYLATYSRIANIFNQAAGEVGFVFCTIVLLTGMIWGHSAWNTWFRWEPRLLTFLLLWLIFLGFNIQRMFGDQIRQGSHLAVIGILGVVTVPIMIFSIKLLPNIPQLHPQVVENRGLRDPSYILTMWVAICALVLLQFILVWFRAKIDLLEDKENGTGA